MQKVKFEETPPTLKKGKAAMVAKVAQKQTKEVQKITAGVKRKAGADQAAQTGKKARAEQEQEEQEEQEEEEDEDEVEEEKEGKDAPWKMPYPGAPPPPMMRVCHSPCRGCIKRSLWCEAPTGQATVCLPCKVGKRRCSHSVGRGAKSTGTGLHRRITVQRPVPQQKSVEFIEDSDIGALLPLHTARN